MLLYREIDHLEGVADVLGSFGYLDQQLGHYTRAIDYYGQPIEIDRELGDPYWEAIALDGLGDVYKAAGNCLLAKVD